MVVFPFSGSVTWLMAAQSVVQGEVDESIGCFSFHRKCEWKMKGFGDRTTQVQLLIEVVEFATCQVPLTIPFLDHEIIPRVLVDQADKRFQEMVAHIKDPRKPNHWPCRRWVSWDFLLTRFLSHLSIPNNLVLPPYNSSQENKPEMSRCLSAYKVCLSAGTTQFLPGFQFQLKKKGTCMFNKWRSQLCDLAVSIFWFQGIVLQS